MSNDDVSVMGYPAPAHWCHRLGRGISQWLEAEVIRIHCSQDLSAAFDALADEFRDLTHGLVKKVVSPLSSPHNIHVVLDLSLFALICRRAPSTASVLVAMANIATTAGIAAQSFTWPHVLPLGTPRGWTWVRHSGWGKINRER